MCFFTKDNNVIAPLVPHDDVDRNSFAAVWDGTDGHLIRRIEKPLELRASVGQVGACDLSPDGTMFAAAGAGIDSRVVIYSTTDWSVVAVNAFSEGASRRTSISAIRFLHQSRRIAVASIGALFISDIGDGENRSPVLRPLGELSFHSLDVDEEDQQVFVGGEWVPKGVQGMSPLVAYNLKSDTAMPMQDLGARGIQSIRWLGDGRLLVSTADSNKILMIDQTLTSRFSQAVGIYENLYDAAVGGDRLAVIWGNRVVIYRR